MWNGLHEALWVRRDRAGRDVGRHRLDPLLWAETVHVLEGDAHDRAVKVLEEFQKREGENLIRDPLKRAVLAGWASAESKCGRTRLFSSAMPAIARMPG